MNELQTDTADIIWRVKPIAVFLGLSEKAAQHRIDRREIPTFRMGGTICARRSTLLAWIAEQEAKALQPKAELVLEPIVEDLPPQDPSTQPERRRPGGVVGSRKIRRAAPRMAA